MPAASRRPAATAADPHRPSLTARAADPAAAAPTRKRTSRYAPTSIDIPAREMYPIPEARQLLGGISHSAFYAAVRRGQITLIRVGRRSYVGGETIRRITGGA